MIIISKIGDTGHVEWNTDEDSIVVCPPAGTGAPFRCTEEFATATVSAIQSIIYAMRDRRDSNRLTGAAKRVLDLIATRGLSNKEIARELGVVEGTVKHHVKAVLAHLGVRTRAEAILAANGLKRVP